MIPYTFILIGRSGSGKGTQVELLKKYIQERDTEKRDIFYLYTGNEFRSFIQDEGYSSTRAREINEVGGLQPAFLAIYMWSKKYIEEFKGDEHVFIDGSPRTYTESLALDSAFTFYKRHTPCVIVIDVSKEEAMQRLLDRGRVDDDRASIEKRVSWFDTTVVPAIEFFKGRDGYHMISVDGEQSIEGVHEDIISGIAPLIG